MNRTAVLNALFWAASFGGLVALLTGERRAVSLRIWLAGVVIWFAAASVRRMLDGVPLVPARIRSLVSVQRKAVTVDASRIRELRALEGLLFRSTTNDRAYTQQLHPRLVELADHFLGVTHGIDRRSQPERVVELLGPHAWMLEPDTKQRTPTLDELDQLIELLTHPTSKSSKEAA